MRTTKPHVKRWRWGGETTKWVVDGLRDDNGKRIRKFFPSRDAANEWLALRRPELKNQGRAAMGMTDPQRVDAVRALAILEPYKCTLTAAAEAFAERARLLEKTVTFAVLRDEYLAAKGKLRKGGTAGGNLSAHYLNDITRRLSRFGKAFDERLVATIAHREINEWLDALGLSLLSRRNYRKVLCTAFQFAVKKEYARDNPVVATENPKLVISTPGILKPAEISAILSAADPSRSRRRCGRTAQHRYRQLGQIGIRARNQL